MVEHDLVTSGVRELRCNKETKSRFNGLDMCLRMSSKRVSFDSSVIYTWHMRHKLLRIVSYFRNRKECDTPGHSWGSGSEQFGASVSV